MILLKATKKGYGSNCNDVNEEECDVSLGLSCAGNNNSKTCLYFDFTSS